LGGHLLFQPLVLFVELEKAIGNFINHSRPVLLSLLVHQNPTAKGTPILSKFPIEGGNPRLASLIKQQNIRALVARIMLIVDCGHSAMAARRPPSIRRGSDSLD
jgi:hypothetical protein